MAASICPPTEEGVMELGSASPTSALNMATADTAQVLDLLAKSIDSQRKALLSNIPASDGVRRTMLLRLASCLIQRFNLRQNSQNIPLLKEAITLQRQACQGSQLLIEDKIDALRKLGESLLLLARTAHTCWAVDEALECERAVLDLCPSGHMPAEQRQELAVLGYTLHEAQTERAGRPTAPRPFWFQESSESTQEPSANEDKLVFKDAIAFQMAALNLFPVNSEDHTLAMLAICESLQERLLKQDDIVTSDYEDLAGYQKKILARCPLGHPDRARHLRVFGGVLFGLYTKSEDQKTLKTSIIYEIEALSLYPADHPTHFLILRSVLSSLMRYCVKFKEVEAAEQAIELCQAALLVYIPGDPRRVDIAASYGEVQEIAIKYCGVELPPDNAIASKQEGLNLVVEDPRKRAQLASSLAVSLSEKYHRTSTRDPKPLVECIELEKQVILLLPPGTMDFNTSLSRLPDHLHALYERTGDSKCVEDAIAYARQALTLFPPGHSLREGFLRQLSRSLVVHYVINRDVSVLEDAIAQAREAVKLCPLEYIARVMALEQLADALDMHSTFTGRIDSLDEGLKAQKEALRLCSTAQSHRHRALSRLAAFYKTRSIRFGDSSSLGQAIRLNREALHCCPPGHREHRIALYGLGEVLQLRAGNVSALDEAVVLLKQALHLQKDTTVGLPPILIEIGSLLCERSKQSKLKVSDKLAYLEEAIGYHRQALDITSREGLVDESRPRLSLASSLVECYMVEGHRTALDEAIELQNEVVQLETPGNITHANALQGLGHAYLCLYEKEGDPISLQSAMEYIERLTSDTFVPPYLQLVLLYNRVSSVLNTVKDKLHLTPLLPCLHRMHNTIIDLLPCAAYLGLEAHARLGTLSGLDGLGSAVAAVALLCNEPARALELLDECHAIFWGQALRLRAPLDDLPKEEAERLTRLFKLMDVNRSNQKWTSAINVSEQQNAAKEADELIARIRTRPTFGSFLRAQVFLTLVKSADKGPVVILVAHQLLCEAVVILDSAGNLKRVTLGRLTVKDVDGLSKAIKSTNLRMKARRNADGVHNADKGSVDVTTEGEDESDFGLSNDSDTETLPGKSRILKVSRARPADNGWDVLARIWKAIVHPIIKALQLQKVNRAQRNRLHWCPTGPFVFIPLHAACSAQKGDSVSEYVLSSYTPTLAALLNARRKLSPIKTSQINALLVAVSKAPDLPPLVNVNDEVSAVAAILSQASPGNSTAILGTLPEASHAPSTQAVLEHIPRASVVHLSCHGEQDPRDPLQSGFCLADGRLTVAELMRLDLRHAFFAFLSACETAKGDAKQPDQAVHLAAAMLFVGFRSVVATMWSMNDEDGPVVADTVYRELTKSDVWDPDLIPYALDLAVSKLRRLGMPPHRWAPYIHMGA